METSKTRVAVLISAAQEWWPVRARIGNDDTGASPYGEWFFADVEGWSEPVLFFHGGWGKIAAAASTQYVIDHWRPQLVINLGTCGGFEGAIPRDTVVLAERTLVYDIVEQMGDPAAALAHYATDLNLTWLRPPDPMPVYRGLLISGDRDLVAEEINGLRARFGAVAGDWESGAIAYVAARNRVRCLILRGVTDLVSPDGGEAYDGTVTFFAERAAHVMTHLVDSLPAWLARIDF